MIKCRNIYKETDSDCPYYFMVRLENGILYVEGLSNRKADYGGERKQLFSKMYNLNRSFISISILTDKNYLIWLLLEKAIKNLFLMLIN